MDFTVQPRSSEVSSWLYPCDFRVRICRVASTDTEVRASATSSFSTSWCAGSAEVAPNP